MKNLNNLMTNAGLIILLILINPFIRNLSAQAPQILAENTSFAIDTNGTIEAFSSAFGLKTGILSVTNFSGTKGSITSSDNYALGSIGGYNSALKNYGIWGHLVDNTQSVGGQGGIFTYGNDPFHPQIEVRLASDYFGIQIKDGTETAGHVLVSDADGIGSWQSPSGLGPWKPEAGGIAYRSKLNTVMISEDLDISTFSRLFVDLDSLGNSSSAYNAIYGLRNGSSNNGLSSGANWILATSGVHGHSRWGNSFSAGVVGSSLLDFTNSAAVIGVEGFGNVWGALGYRDVDGDLWGGYIGMGGMYVENELQIATDATSAHSEAIFNADGGYVHLTDTMINFYGDNLGGNFLIATEERDSESSGINGNSNALTFWSPGDSHQGEPAAYVYILDEDSWTGHDGDPYNNNALKLYLSSSGVWMASDIRRKENINTYSNGLDKIKNINTYSYQYKKDGDKEEVQPTVIGVMAQELINIVPEAVQVSDKGDHYVNYSQLVPVLIDAVKDQQKQIDQQQQQIAALQALVNQLVED